VIASSVSAAPACWTLTNNSPVAGFLLSGPVARGANPFSADVKIVVRYAINQVEGGGHSSLLGTSSLRENCGGATSVLAATLARPVSRQSRARKPRGCAMTSLPTSRAPTGLLVATVVGARKIRADAPPSRRSLRDPVAAAMRVAAGSWIPVFGVVVAMDVATALLALLALKQMRAAYLGARTSGPLAELAPAASRRGMSRRTDQPLWRRCLSKCLAHRMQRFRACLAEGP
jgi:hypothetical protein